MTEHAEDHLFSALVVIAAATLGLGIIATPAAPEGVHSPSTRKRPPALIDPLDARIIMIADAIATGEGFYAPGTHNGRSLPYRLNNPGSLKKPALGAEDLPTWQDTGLVIFPSKEMGWAALYQQVRAMLTGTSMVYDRCDTLEAVGSKYADGDPNWATNVASVLGVTTDVTLAELAVPSGAE